MIEQGSRESDVSTASLTIQQLVGVNRRIASKGIERSLFQLSQYALAATDVGRLLEKGAGIIAEAIPLAYVVIAETKEADALFCIRATAGQHLADIVNAVCDRRCLSSPKWRSTITGRPEIQLSENRRYNYPAFKQQWALGKRERVTVISGKKKPFGLLITGEKDRCLTEDEVQFIRASADVLAIAIDRIEAHQASSRSEALVKRNLEHRIQERSEQLFQANIQLSQSIEQYKRTEAALRRSEEDLRALSAQLIETAEQERKRIASELHDSISQAMTSIKFRLECSLMHFEKGAADEGVAIIANAIPTIQSAIQEVRRISMDLRPSMLDDIGILAAIEWYCKEYQQTYQGIRVLQHIDVQEPDIAENLKLVIFRVIQEALHNIARHSNANVARLELQCAGRSLVLRIIDNGNGFIQSRQSTQEPAVRGLGLRSMRERVEQTLGIFNITSRPGVGTTIEASWPLAALSLADQPLLHRKQG